MLEEELDVFVIEKEVCHANMLCKPCVSRKRPAPLPRDIPPQSATIPPYPTSSPSTLLSALIIMREDLLEVADDAVMGHGEDRGVGRPC